MGYAADHIERQLAHAPANKVRGIYNHAEYLAERATMRVGPTLDSLRDGATVLPFKRPG